MSWMTTSSEGPRRFAIAAGLAITASTSLAGSPAAGQEPHTIDEVSWIAGHWRGDATPLGGGTAEEGWFGPAGRSMSGVFRLVPGEPGKRARVFELLLIEEEDGELFYRFKHVGPGWRPWEEEPLEYRLVELAERRAVFHTTSSTPIAGTPMRFEYRRPADERLEILIEGWEGERLELMLTRVP